VTRPTIPDARGNRPAAATTRWTLILRAVQQSGPEAAAALASLSEIYWYPVYAFIRRKGYATEEARDLTQSFFARLIEREFLSAADPARGRFRAFLLTAVRHFLANEYHRENSLKRGGEYDFVALDFDSGEERYSAEPPAAQLSPEALYERRWALTVLKNALADLQAQAAEGGWREHLDALQPLLVGNDRPYDEIAMRLGMTPGALRVAVHRLRRRYARVIRDRIAETVASPDDVDGEIAYLMKVVGRGART
jgi:RNA polymerase sigma-70 factor (ECF subfamily)